MINDSYGPLVRALPLSLADKTHRPEEEPEVDNGRRSDDKRHEAVDSALGASSSDPRFSQSPISPDSKSGVYFDDLFFSQYTDGTVDYGFAHPALARPQRVVWIPDDTTGLGREEAQTNEASGVLTTTTGASMDEAGHVEVTAPPVDLNKF